MKAPTPILVTESGIVTEVRLLHPQKAYSPILVTELGIMTEVRLLQEAKASTIIIDIFSGIE